MENKIDKKHMDNNPAIQQDMKDELYVSNYMNKYIQLADGKTNIKLSKKIFHV